MAGVSSSVILRAIFFCVFSCMMEHGNAFLPLASPLLPHLASSPRLASMRPALRPQCSHGAGIPGNNTETDGHCLGEMMTGADSWLEPVMERRSFLILGAAFFGVASVAPKQAVANVDIRKVKASSPAQALDMIITMKVRYLATFARSRTHLECNECSLSYLHWRGVLCAGTHILLYVPEDIY